MTVFALNEYRQDLTIVAGTPLVFKMVGPNVENLTISAIPGASGTLLVESTTASDVDIDGATATWYAWPDGAVSVPTKKMLIGKITALRFTAATADGTIELLA